MGPAACLLFLYHNELAFLYLYLDWETKVEDDDCECI